jgi:hypothetical protein
MITNEHLTFNIKNLINKKYLFYILCFTFIGFLAVKSVHHTYAKSSNPFPVQELGNCRNSQECYLYCRIPENTPACWSYGKFILNGNVLGETTQQQTPDGVVYPIVELGGCTSPKECYTFCSKEENLNTCKEYGKNKGLIKTSNKSTDETISAAKNELGCQTKEECQTFCEKEENRNKCLEFAQKYDLQKGQSLQTKNIATNIIAKAQKELGCKTEEECKNFCSIEENREKCSEFGRKEGLVKENPEKKQEATINNQVIDQLKKEINCDTNQGCIDYCLEKDNKERCTNLYKTIKQRIIQKIKDSLPCTGDEECRKYCQEHPNQCPGYLNLTPLPTLKAVYNATPITGTSLRSNPTPQPGTYLGPGGCKTESECKAYCLQHPDLCPGFPKPTLTVSPTKIISKTPTPKPQAFYQQQVTNTTANTYISPTKFISSPTPTHTIIVTKVMVTATPKLDYSTYNYQPTPTLRPTASTSLGNLSGGTNNYQPPLTLKPTLTPQVVD